MAEFCKQCSIDIFDQDHGDFAGIVTEKEYKEQKLAGLVLCEGCGNTFVDHEGTCLDPNCLKHHGRVDE
ncbi:hypothetical protein [Acinetobacter sp.]|uniref:hypothetical protein n=1 Tax=Acinetobacter sp. TaxID=472 RepID=UPI003D088A0E